MITALFKKVFTPSSSQQSAYLAYCALVEQSRKPFFYNEGGVEDSIDGRFDVIVLHMFLLTQRLQKESPEFLRNVWEAFFYDMDRNLREMGVSDTGVGKRIKKMVQAFYGRMDVYEKSVSNTEEFKESLVRNLYRDKEIRADKIDKIVEYVKRNIEYFQEQSITDIESGKILFRD